MCQGLRDGDKFQTMARPSDNITKATTKTYVDT